jgi:hypothetical protein
MIRTKKKKGTKRKAKGTNRSHNILETISTDSS